MNHYTRFYKLKFSAVMDLWNKLMFAWCNTFCVLLQRTHFTYQDIIDYVVTFLYFSSQIGIRLVGVSCSNSSGVFKHIFIVPYFYQTWFLGFLRVVSSLLWVAWPFNQEVYIIGCGVWELGRGWLIC